MNQIWLYEIYKSLYSVVIYVPVHWKVKKKDDHYNFLKLKVSFLTGSVWPTLQNPKDDKYSESSIIQDNLTSQKL